MNPKQTRHAKIKEIIEKQSIETQEELVNCLQQEGFNVTQATVSRDIRQMRLSKLSSPSGKLCYALPQKTESHLEERYIRVLQDAFVSMDMAQNILVMKTVPGMAMAVAAAIDAIGFTEVVGCIAGDDTIMAAVRTVEDTKRLMERLHSLIS